ncbi:MAG TPA: hypothetical protein VFU19_15465 [Iamia sp.]|nr:hypothetical protein [Iamia sp.]
MPSTDDLFPNGLRDVPYGEVLLVSESDGTYTAEVWNTLGLNDCPREAWDALDATAIAAERGALVARLNGPRRWTLDTIVTEPKGERRLSRFGELDMFLAATVDLGASLPAPGVAYEERRVARDTVFRFAAGATIHQLTAPNGERYVMQAYSHAVDATQGLDTLAALADRLALPPGWAFTTRTIEQRLDLLSTDGVATVVQDELQNTYQRIDAVSVAAMGGGD